MLSFAHVLHQQMVWYGRREFFGLPFVPLFSFLNLLRAAVFRMLRRLVVAQSHIPMSLSCLLSCLINSRSLNICVFCLQSQNSFSLAFVFYQHVFLSLYPSQYLSILLVFGLCIQSVIHVSFSTYPSLRVLITECL